MRRTVLTLVVSLFLLPIGGADAAGQSGGDVSAAPAVEVSKSGFPIVQEQITLRGFGRLEAQHGPWEEMTLWKDYEAMTNVHVEWETPGMDNVAERKNLILASGDVPEFFIKNVLTESDVLKYGAAGVLIPLEDLIDEWAPNLISLMEKYPSVRKAITAPDGHIYSLPRVCDFQPGLIGRYPLVNMAWLERVGLEPAETSQEFLDMLRAFRDNDANGNGDPNDEVPYSSHNAVHAFRGISGMFDVDYQVRYDVGSLGRYPMKMANGKLHIQLTDPGMRDALQYYTTMYQEGLLDQEIFIHAKKAYFAKLAAGRVGFTPLFQPKNAGKYAGEYDAMYPPSGPGGVRKWNFGNPFLTNINCFSITHVNPYPEATMRWVDYFYGDEGGLQMYLVRPEEFTTIQSDGSYTFKKEVFGAEMGFTRFMGSHTIYPGGSVPTYANETNYRPMMVGPMLDYIKKVTDYLPREVVVLPIRSEKDQERELEIRSQMDTYIMEMWANFATGEVSFDDWDQWVTTLEKMGLTELEEILQRALSGS